MKEGPGTEFDATEMVPAVEVDVPTPQLGVFSEPGSPTLEVIWADGELEGLYGT